jgi:hypothetical protein
MINESWIGKDLQAINHGLTEVLSQNLSEGNKEIVMERQLDGRYPGRDSNRVPPVYNSRTLLLDQPVRLQSSTDFQQSSARFALHLGNQLSWQNFLCFLSLSRQTQQIRSWPFSFPSFPLHDSLSNWEQQLHAPSSSHAFKEYHSLPRICYRVDPRASLTLWSEVKTLLLKESKYAARSQEPYLFPYQCKTADRG